MARPRAEDIREIAIALDPEFAEAVSRWDIRVGEDWRGEPGVFVTIVLRDDGARAVWPTRDGYRTRLLQALLEALPEDYFPFISFSAESIALNPEIPVRA